MNTASGDTSCICLQVRKADRHLSRIYDAILRPSGIRITQYGLLFCIENLQEPSISEIGQSLSMDQTTVTRNIMKLESMGLVEARPDIKNQHKKLVTLTASGRKALAKGQAALETAQAHVKAYLGEIDYAILLNLLAKLTIIPGK